MATNWNKTKTNDFCNYSAATIYNYGDYTIWRGKYCVFSAIYSADEWHLQRTSDRKVIYSARTAKECMEAFEQGKR